MLEGVLLRYDEDAELTRMHTYVNVKCAQFHVQNERLVKIRFEERVEGWPEPKNMYVHFICEKKNAFPIILTLHYLVLFILISVRMIGWRLEMNAVEMNTLPCELVKYTDTDIFGEGV